MDKTIGTAPLTVNYDATASVAPNGLKAMIAIYPNDFYSPYRPLRGTLEFPNPGIYKMELLVWDNLSYPDSTVVIISVLAPTQTDPIPPTLVPPEITLQPVNKTFLSGQPLSLTSAATGTSPLLFHWVKNGIDIPDATNMVYAKTVTTTNDSGSYLVRVSNQAGVVQSAIATVTITNAPPPPPPPIQTLSASLSTWQSAYSRKDKASIGVLVRSGGLPVSGATVGVMVTSANGKIRTASLVTGSNGIASYSYTISPSGGIGNYSVTASATKSGYSPSNIATTSFTVRQ